jgi:CheY-like chemotaxis protein
MEPVMAKIVVVEDEPGLLELICEELQFMGHEPTPASDGRIGLELIRAGNPDLVLMDLDFGGRRPNGLEVTEQLKEDRATRHIPIIVMTGRVMQSERERAFAAGCDELVEKGFKLDDLFTAVQTQLGLKG